MGLLDNPSRGGSSHRCDTGGVGRSWRMCVTAATGALVLLAGACADDAGTDDRASDAACGPSKDSTRQSPETAAAAAGTHDVLLHQSEWRLKKGIHFRAGQGALGMLEPALEWYA